MPTYSYRCAEHGVFDQVKRMIEHAEGDCPTCEAVCPQVITRAPGLDMEAMSRIGMPGAWDTVGERITKRHRNAGQHHRPAERK